MLAFFLKHAHLESTFIFHLHRNQAVNFWSDESNLPIHPTAKLLSLLGEFYDPVLDEVNYMTNVINLLLQSASLSPDFERSLFDLPLSECVFQVQDICGLCILLIWLRFDMMVHLKRSH